MRRVEPRKSGKIDARDSINGGSYGRWNANFFLASLPAGRLIFRSTIIEGGQPSFALVANFLKPSTYRLSFSNDWLLIVFVHFFFFLFWKPYDWTEERIDDQVKRTLYTEILKRENKKIETRETSGNFEVHESE